VTTRASAHAAAESVIENCAAAETTTPDCDLAREGSCTSATVATAPATRVAVIKTGPGTVSRGGQVAYTLTVTNRSAVVARETVLGDVFVDGVAVTGVPHGCTLDGATLTCAIGRLPGGAARTFRVTATAGQHLQPGTVIENCGTVYTSTAEADLADNGACVQTVVSPGPAFVSVTG
jgi:large repetitive protein